MAELKNWAKKKANEASPAALPTKLNQPHTYDASGAYRMGTSCADQWYTLPAEGYAEQISAILYETMVHMMNTTTKPQKIVAGPGQQTNKLLVMH